jgi:hypothetical protein|tara:strand:+ start:517 stop:909 length:393 start_codon:yes stop_codon:yes gene_type:complete
MGLWDIFKNKAHQAMKNDYYKESSKSDDYIATPDQLDAIGNELDAVYKDIFSISGGANANRKITDWCFANLPEEDTLPYREALQNLITKCGNPMYIPGEPIVGTIVSHADIDRIKDQTRYLVAKYKQNNS